MQFVGGLIGTQGSASSPEACHNFLPTTVKFLISVLGLNTVLGLILPWLKWPIS